MAKATRELGQAIGDAIMDALRKHHPECFNEKGYVIITDEDYAWVDAKRAGRNPPSTIPACGLNLASEDAGMDIRALLPQDAVRASGRGAGGSVL